MKSRTKIWLGVGAFVVAGTGGAPHSAIGAPAAAFDRPGTMQDLKRGASIPYLPAGSFRLAEANDGGEGGEAGIDVAAAEKDPVEYGVALQVIAAHYHAGLAAYEAGDKEAGTQMFAHGLAEVYAGMEDLFRKRGVTTLGQKMNDAVDAAAKNLPVAQVRQRVLAVLSAVAAAEKTAPRFAMPALAIKAKVVANLLDRAAKQYGVALKDKELEPYLDGLGFSLAARTEAPKVLPALRRADKTKAAAFTAALALAKEAYPGIHRPDTKVAADKFLAAAEAAVAAVANWK